MLMSNAWSNCCKTGLILSSLLLTACLGGGGATRVNYYLVDPEIPTLAETESDKQLAIELIDLHIPQYLQRFQLVTRDGDNRLRFSDTNQWAENLRKNLMRTLSINLASRLSTIDIGSPLNRSASPPDYRVHVHIAQFELDSQGLVQLSARWQLSSADEEDLGMHFASLESDTSINSGDFDRVVADMQDLFGQFCDRIASSIMALENEN